MGMTAEKQRAYPLSTMQEGMLFHHLASPNSGVDIEQIVCELHEDLDPAIFRDAWRRIAGRFPTLRTSFHWDDRDQPEQIVHETVEVPFEFQDWSDSDPADQQRRLTEFLAADRRTGFDPKVAPLQRVSVFRFGTAAYVSVWSFHHLIADGRSFHIVLGDLFTVYEALRRGEEPQLARRPAYEEYISWVAGRDAAGDEAFWREVLDGFSTPTTLSVPPGPDEPATAVQGRGECEVCLSRSTTDELNKVARTHNITLNTIVQGAWALLLSRYTGEEDIVFGAARAGRQGTVDGAADIVGVFIKTLPVRVRVSGDATVASWLKGIRAEQVRVRDFEHMPLVEIHKWSAVPAGTPLFESIIVFDRESLNTTMRKAGGPWLDRHFELHEQTNFPFTLYGYGEAELRLKLAYDRDRLSEGAARRVTGHLHTILEAIAADPQRLVSEIPLLTVPERQQLQEWNETSTEYARHLCVHELFEEQAARTPEAMALVFEDERLTYAELNRRANRLAHHLRALGLGPDQLVGVCVDRSVELVVAILGVLKAGGAYVPLDPDYPTERIRFMIADSQVGVLLTQEHLVDTLPKTTARVIRLDTDWKHIAENPADNRPSGAEPAHLAYVIYTSGSTGQPKGVMIEHRNVVNFFTGMDARIEHAPGDVWLAVTSLSFDISVLELLWTLSRGLTVVLYAGDEFSPNREDSPAITRPIDFGLFYFASDEGEHGSEKYRLLLEGAKFADTHGFSSVSTPERHFHAFGGLYPNPAVTGAALAAITDRVQIRGGSVVLPLHHPIRVAEEWAVVDNLSGGRVGISAASGWQPNDFVLAPDNYPDRRERMFRDIETIRALWRGETVSFPNHDGDPVEVRTLPRPVQDELPIWVTIAGSPDTYKRAGDVGANVLTHMLGQDLADLKKNLEVYRQAWRDAGHPGTGQVTLMLHTFVGSDDEAVRETVREPMKNYLRSSVSLVRNFATAWTAYRRGVAGVPKQDDDLNNLSAEQMEDLLDFAFERYYRTSGLFGTPESCLEMVQRVVDVGVDEIACLIDFGVPADTVLEHLEHLAALQRRVHAPKRSPRRGLADLIREHSVTHLQCTPSMAAIMTTHRETGAELGRVRQLLVGGEALPGELASKLRGLTDASITNMYGPTETTIWSSTHVVEDGSGPVPIGRPIANTEFYILDRHGQPTPVGVAGELLIGGHGVARGYLKRPELTAERFIAHPFSSQSDVRLYRTGDLARYRPDGTVEFLGRIDHQVKLRGHRIELGEIEALLVGHDNIREAVVVAREDVPGDRRLVAYVVSDGASANNGVDLRAYLERQLPEFMIPAAFVFLPELPLTPNKKIDRKALPAPSDTARAEPIACIAPDNALQRSIADLWQDVLQVPTVGLDDNFFDLGGHSLLAVQVHSRLRNLTDREVAITDLFRFPTVRLLSEHLQPNSRSDDTIRKGVDRGEARKAAMRQRPRRQRA